MKRQDGMGQDRTRDAEAWFNQQRRFVEEEIQQACDPEGLVDGFRIHIGYACEGAKRYDGAFLPAEVAAKYPQLLPPYEGICQFGRCECEFEEVIEADDLPPNMPVIVGLGKVTTVRKHKDGNKVVHLLVVVAIIVALLYMLFR